ncbi:hypothetical protein OSTOST_10603 [Ostertagia ostertagi]
MLDEPRESDDEVVVHDEAEEDLDLAATQLSVQCPFQEIISQRKNLPIAPVRRGLPLKNQQETTQSDETVAQNKQHHRYGGLKKKARKVFEAQDKTESLGDKLCVEERSSKAMGLEEC